ncbi:ubiquitin-protein transferase activating protein CDC20 [Ascoidea rubescens DSM 1968]|uniref:WD40 repeat-like protein n=1 Tax=Ascoidea rubescens DSM 1968 TaxID=1344418 RepID=A0A1D2VCA5_9ASCO|nr:WD40 repeat-like protein [Ascoidea rubescens DSM 1968]ODV59170.1 WD40 repeat-like protein [Ascoidea rubescens DSM 1968]
MSYPEQFNSSPLKLNIFNTLSPNISTSSFFDNPISSSCISNNNIHYSNKHKPENKSKNNLINKNYFSKPTHSSTNFNIATSDWNKNSLDFKFLNNSLKLEKDSKSKSTTSKTSNDKKSNKNNDSTNQSDNNTNTQSTNSINSSPTRRLKKSLTNDRFIPTRHTSAGKLFAEEVTPKPTDSPLQYIECQNSKIYQSSVAKACGVDTHQRILQFQPPPPERSAPINLCSKFATTLNDQLNFTVPSKGIKPSAAIARIRKTTRIPEKVLDAPGLIDNYYINVLSWSKTNLLAIALQKSVYIWNASLGIVGSLTECETIVSSIRWSEDGDYLSIGTEDGDIQVWDIEASKKLRTMTGHDTRVGSQCWNSHLITSGSRNGAMFHHDVRIPDHIVSRMKSHTAEVCGIEWRHDGHQLASGGNDNIVNIWDARSSIPQFTKTVHKSAVKALSWSPTQSNLLATAGGTADRHIHFWNTASGARVNSIDTGCQISSLNWGYSDGVGVEIVATHAFPNSNISIYSYPTLQKTGEILNAHDGRILCCSLSPDNTTIATASADETLKFWKIFDYPKFKFSNGKSTLADDNKDIRKVMTLR